MATILDTQRTSFVGQTMPDPTMMAHTVNRFKSLEKDRETIQKMMQFGQSQQMSTMSPRRLPPAISNLEFRSPHSSFIQSPVNRATTNTEDLMMLRSRQLNNDSNLGNVDKKMLNKSIDFARR